MKPFTLSILLMLITSFAQAADKAWVVDIDGIIGPATADYFQASLREAVKHNVALIIIRMDTPGGLDTAMRDIIQAITTSPIPVVSYVSPSGARAASAGTYILYASHIAAMAPGTNLGAATPVQLGGMNLSTDTPTTTDNMEKSADNEDKEKQSAEKQEAGKETLTKKMVNDAEAYLRSLAQMRGRNMEWAMEAVRDSASLSAEDALEKKVIDVIAEDIPQLLEKIQGRDVKMPGGKLHQLNTTGLIVENHEPDWRIQLLSILTNPNIAYLLMLAGIYGLFFELYNPGSVFPGVIGGISLLLALLAFQVLPINYAGVALILLGLGFIVAEAFLPSFGVLGIGGIVSFIIGSIILIDNDLPGYQLPNYGVSPELIAGISLATVLIIIFIVRIAVKAHSMPVVSGREQLIGSIGECLSNENGKLRIYVRSETWSAYSKTPIQPGQSVKVINLEGLTLEVEVVE